MHRFKTILIKSLNPQKTPPRSIKLNHKIRAITRPRIKNIPRSISKQKEIIKNITIINIKLSQYYT